MDICGFLGVTSSVGQKLVNWIIKYGYALIALSFVAVCLSGATLSSFMAASDYIKD